MTGGRRLLLHICCAPDATVPWPELTAEGYEVSGFFYGSNIHPEGEWRRRRDAVLKLANAVGSPAEFSLYEPDEWRAGVVGMENCPEGGERCGLCFGLQLGAAARLAASGGYDALCTTLTISPHKNPAIVNEAGRTESARLGVEWIDRVWRKNDGFRRSVARSTELGLYRQNYCGCEYSARNIEGIS
ncbi:MAG: epoxyqueuosine reductase QueH [Synergistaceae bacterium]|nr:epoxyqueuosine reductase QueH [Synergistaceae bacterium]